MGWCKSAAIRTSFTFPIPEIISLEENVNRAFQFKNIKDSLYYRKHVGYTIKGFNNDKPADEQYHNFRNYSEKFWNSFKLTSTITNLIPHFPFVLESNYRPIRDFNQKIFDLATYESNIQVRIFPYGAVSIHISELVEFSNPVSSNQLIDFINSQFLFNNEKYKVKRLLEIIRNNILHDVLKTSGQFTLLPINPHVLINPQFAKNSNLEDLPWKDIATLLALSTKDQLIKQYKKKNTKNFSRRDSQLFLTSKFATILFTPDENDFNNYAHGIICLLDRMTNVCELVSIQENYACQYQNIFKQIIVYLASQTGYPANQIKTLFTNPLDRNVIVFLLQIFSFQNLLSQNNWKLWYAHKLDSQKETIENFIMTLNELNTTNVKLGQDARNSLKEIIKTSTSILDSVKSLIPTGT